MRGAAVDVAAVGGAVEDPFVASLDDGGGRRGHGMPAEAKAAAALVLAAGQVLPLRTAFVLPAASLLLLLPTSLLVLAWLRWC